MDKDPPQRQNVVDGNNCIINDQKGVLKSASWGSATPDMRGQNLASPNENYDKHEGNQDLRQDVVDQNNRADEMHNGMLNSASWGSAAPHMKELDIFANLEDLEQRVRDFRGNEIFEKILGDGDNMVSMEVFQHEQRRMDKMLETCFAGVGTTMGAHIAPVAKLVTCMGGKLTDVIKTIVDLEKRVTEIDVGCSRLSGRIDSLYDEMLEIRDESMGLAFDPVECEQHDYPDSDAAD